MNDLKNATDQQLVLEIYRRIKGEDEMSQFRNFCYRAAFRPLFTAFDKANTDEVYLRMWKTPNWERIEAERDETLSYFPEPEGEKGNL